MKRWYWLLPQTFDECVYVIVVCVLMIFGIALNSGSR